MHRHIVTQTVPRLILGALLALFPLVGFPLGLGKLQVKSALNEPLNAEIDITAAADHELKGLNVSLAPRADFEAAGAERLPLLSQIKFIVAKRPDGRYYLQLKTDAPIEEPFLHVLLQLEWPGGRLVREYTALIDPPSYIAGKPPVTEAPQTAVPTPISPAESSSKFVETVPPPSPDAEKAPVQAAAPAMSAEPMTAAPVEPQPAEATPLPRTAPTQEATPQEVTVAAPTEQPAEQPVAQASPQPVGTSPATAPANATEYTVRPGDTLWAIADRMRTDKQLSIEQVIVAIFRNNKDAFYRDNVNNLRAGKILKLPEREVVDATPRNEALREFRAQYDAWQEYKLKLAGGSSTLKVADSKPVESKPESAADAGKTDAAKKPEAPAEKAAQAKQSPQELLKVVRGAADADKSAVAKSAETESAKDVEKRERTALAERVTTLEESLQSKQLENRELSEKVGQVRSQIKNEKRLIELENQTLAQQTAKQAPESKPAAAPKPETAADKPAAPPAAAPTEVKPAPAPEMKKPDAPPAQPVKAAPKRQPIAPPPPPPEKGFLASLYDDLIGDSLLPVVGGIVALAGGVILIIYMRRRRRSIAEFEESILASDAMPSSEATAPTGTADTTGQVTTGDTSFLSDFSKSGMGQVHTDEVDPIAEAEVYLAYGRDETAEEILKEAIVKNPDRQELKQKLLEIYHQRNDVNAFETLAEELYAALAGRGGKVWEKVEEMGRKLNPENPMFRGGAPGRRAADKGERPVAQGMQSVSLSAGAVAVGAGAGAGTIAATQATQIVNSGSSVDFDFDASIQPAGTADATKSADSGLDFDLNVPSVSSDGAIDEQPASRPASAELSELESIDFGSIDDNVVAFDSNKADSAVEDAAAPLEAAAVAEDEIKWEMDTPVAAAAAAEATDAGAGGNGADGHWDETATKLDLAKAYIDMGDAEGARSILDEVLAEGNEQQKKQAAELAAQIA